MFNKSFAYFFLCSIAVALIGLDSSIAVAKSLKQSIAVTLESNPEIGQAVQNREAIEFELRQARGLYLPKVDLEAGVGVRRLNNPSRRRQRIDDDPLYPSDVGVTITQKLFDGFGRRAEVERQAARVDSASFRVLERSEFIALNVTREYFQIVLQYKIIEAAKKNVRVHQRIASEISRVEEQGNLTAADRQQARERLIAARVRLKEATEELITAKIAFNKLVGMPAGQVKTPQLMSHKVPKSLKEAIGIARNKNPRLKISSSDIATAHALIKSARSNYFPEVSIEGNARYGEDIDGVEGREDDLQARLVLKWNLYKGGIDVANEQEQIRRASEARHRHHQAHREVEEAVRVSWERMQRQREIYSLYSTQLITNNTLVSSYNQQFRVGRRSLLDLLDAQNTRFNTEVLALTSNYAHRFAQYRLLAATGQLLDVLNLKAPDQAEAYARDIADAPPIPDAELEKLLPSDQHGRFGYHKLP